MSVLTRIRRMLPVSVGNSIRRLIPRSIKSTIARRLTRGIAAKTPIVTARDGRRFKTIEDALFFRVFYEGIYEPDLSAAFESLIDHQDCIIDVGGNFGWYATLFAKFANHGKVISYEPVPDTFEVLCENIELNGMQAIIQPHPVCVGESAGKVSFLRTDNSGLGHVATGSDGGESMEIDLITLDSHLSHLTGQIAIIKIHVEGFELNVLKGSTKLLASENAPIIQIKLTDDRLERYGIHRHDITQFLQDAGMEVYELVPGGAIRKSSCPVEHEIFAVKSGRFAQRFLDQVAANNSPA